MKASLRLLLAAATVLLALTRLLGLDLSKAELMREGVKLGADVPFFLNPQPALAGGIGEQLSPVPAAGRWPSMSTLPAAPSKPRTSSSPSSRVKPGTRSTISWAFVGLNAAKKDGG